MQLPIAFLDGYRRMSGSDPDWSERYAQHLTVGDALADAAIEALAPLCATRQQSLIRACMERDYATLRGGERALVDLLESVEAVPSWFDPEHVSPGCGGFHANSDVLALTFVVGSGVEGFATVIAKSFFATGRLVDFGVRRARQNLWHLMEIMLPGGLDRAGDGWKLTLRIRLIHAQVRRQLRAWDGWDEATDGMPISSAHLALAAAMFSARCLECGESLGVKLSHDERSSFLNIWRYTAWLLGVPEPLLFRDYEDALALCRVGRGCEPEPGLESIAMANAFINSIPLLGGLSEPSERRKFARKLYRISRALIGDELADKFRFPRQSTMLLLPALRLKRRLKPVAQLYSREDTFLYFSQLLDFVKADELGLQYTLPPQLYSDQGIEW